MTVYLFSNKDLNKIEIEKAEMDTEIIRQLVEKKYNKEQDIAKNNIKRIH